MAGFFFAGVHAAAGKASDGTDVMALAKARCFFHKSIARILQRPERLHFQYII